MITPIVQIINDRTCARKNSFYYIIYICLYVIGASVRIPLKVVARPGIIFTHISRTTRKERRIDVIQVNVQQGSRLLIVNSYINELIWHFLQDMFIYAYFQEAAAGSKGYYQHNLRWNTWWVIWRYFSYNSEFWKQMLFPSLWRVYLFNIRPCWLLKITISFKSQFHCCNP